MKGLSITAGLLSALLSINSQAQQDDQSNTLLSDELTNISNEEGTAFYLKLGLGAVKFNDQTVKGAGLTAQHIEFNKGFSLHATAGLEIGEHAAVELEFSRQLSNISNDNTGIDFNRAIGSYSTAMVNVIFKPNLKNVSENINPYVGAGLGISRAKYTSPGKPLQKETKTVSAKQYFLGNRFELRDDFFIDAEYRYFKTGAPKLVSEGGLPFEFDNSGSQSLVVSYGKNF